MKKIALALAAAEKAAECQKILIALSGEMNDDSSKMRVLKVAKKVGKVSGIAGDLLG